MNLSPSAVETKRYLMISALIDNLRREGYEEIEADHVINAVRPPEMAGDEGPCIPDVVASKEGRRLYFEVRTEQDLFDPATEGQIRTIYRHARETGGEFCLLVPVRCATRTKYLLEMLDLPGITVAYI